MKPDLVVKREKTPAGHPVIRLNGEFDSYTCSRVRSVMIELIEKGTNDLLIDLTGVEYIDSSGLGVLVGGSKRINAKGGKIHLLILDSQIREVFRMTGLERIFPIYQTEEEFDEEMTKTSAEMPLR